MTTSSSPTRILMANQRQHTSSRHLLALLIVLVQLPIIIIAEQQTRSESAGASSHLTPNNPLRSTVLPPIINNDDAVYDGDSDNSEADIYDDGDGFQDMSSSSTISQVNVTPEQRNGTSYVHEENDYNDEPNLYQDISNDVDEDDDDDEDSHVFADTMSVNRPEFKRPIVDDTKKPVNGPTTSRLPFLVANLWQNLFSRPAILVGIIGGCVLGMLSAILLVMFIIYRMRKKDEGSYALEEGPSKSPSHAYTRVSSREFFA